MQCKDYNTFWLFFDLFRFLWADVVIGFNFEPSSYMSFLFLNDLIVLTIAAFVALISYCLGLLLLFENQ